MKKNFRKILPVFISLLIILFLYRKIDFVQFLDVIENAKISILLLGTTLSLLLAIIGGLRFSYFSRIFNILPSPSFKTSLKSYFLASTFNIFLPSKLGDLSKGFICEKIDKKKYSLDLSLFSIYEKVSDLFALLFITLFLYLLLLSNNYCEFNISSKECFISSNIIFGLFLIILCSSALTLVLGINNNLISKYLFIFFPKKIKEKIPIFSNISLKKVIFYQIISILIWAIHLFQLSIFAYSVNIGVSFDSGLLFLALTILIGLLPISFAGIGTREAALVFFFSTNHDISSCLMLGFLFTSRYFIPGFFGITLLPKLINN